MKLSVWIKCMKVAVKENDIPQNILNDEECNKHFILSLLENIL